MALNTETGIDYGIDRFAIRKVSTGQVINTNAVWLRVDGGVANGANDDNAYYKKTDTQAPDSDHRFSKVVTWHFVDDEPAKDPADGLPVGIYTQDYALTPLPLETLVAQIETQFQAELRARYPAIDDPALLIIAADAITRKQSGATLTTEQEEMLGRVLALGDAVVQLQARKAELIAAAEAFDADPLSDEGIYDILDGWDPA